MAVALFRGTAGRASKEVHGQSMRGDVVAGVRLKVGIPGGSVRPAVIHDGRSYGEWWEMLVQF
jgi:hypothetical protein